MACLKNSTIGGLTVACSSNKNLFLGAGTLANSTGTNCFNTAIGNCALNTLNSNGSCNTAIGSGALIGINSTNASNNTAIGYKAGYGSNVYSNIGAADNTFIGSRAGGGAGTRDRHSGNTFIGFRAGEDNGGTNSVGIGAYSLSNCYGDVQTAIGFLAGYTSNYNFNVFIGTCAGCDGSNGDDNTIIGCLAGTVSGNGSNNVMIGASATNACIGYGCSNTVIMGNAYTTYANVGSSWVNPSDCRDKTDIENLPNNLGLNFIRKLRPVSYKWDNREKYVNKCAFDYGQKDGTLKNPKLDSGFIAQEVKTAIEELNVEFDALKYNTYKDQYQIEYEALVSPIIKSLQEINSEIDQLETLIQQ